METKVSIERRIVNMLRECGVTAEIKGYAYLKEAIILNVSDDEYCQRITKLLYPTVAKKFSTTSSRVERAIRHAVEVAWERGNIKALEDIFGYTVSADKGKPTNSSFIATLTEQIKLDVKEEALQEAV